MGKIARYHPLKFADFMFCQANRQTLQRLQQQAIKRDLIKALLIGAYGGGKTSFARLLMRSYCCRHPDPITADPCNQCEGCQRQGPKYNGDFHVHRHWEIDCTQNIDHKLVNDYLSEASQGPPAALFFDELQELSRKAQSPLRKYLDDVPQGLFLAATMFEVTTHPASPPRVTPPLWERLTKIHLHRPQHDELTDHLLSKLPLFEVVASRELITELVRRTNRSMRTCLSVLDAAFANPGHKLDRETLDAYVPVEDVGFDLQQL